MNSDASSIMQKKQYNKGFEVLTAAIMKISVFWDITPCSPLKVNRRFRGTSLAT
jgi:hypothetical protein